VLSAVSTLARTPGQAIVLVTLVSLAASWLNWGFGLVIGAMFARQLARRVTNVDYRLLIASAYSGFLVWHGGLAGSVPLTIATPGHFLAERMGVISTSQTIFSSFNLLIVQALFIIVPLLSWLMWPPAQPTIAIDPAKLAETPPTPVPATQTPAHRMENSILL